MPHHLCIHQQCFVQFERLECLRFTDSFLLCAWVLLCVPSDVAQLKMDVLLECVPVTSLLSELQSATASAKSSSKHLRLLCLRLLLLRLFKVGGVTC